MISVLIGKQSEVTPKPSLKSKLSELIELVTGKVLTRKSDFSEYFLCQVSLKILAKYEDNLKEHSRTSFLFCHSLVMSDVAAGNDDSIHHASLKLSFIIKYLLPDARADILATCHSTNPYPDGTPGSLLESGSVAEGISLPNMLMRQPNSKDIPVKFFSGLDSMYCVEMEEEAMLETWKQNTDLKPSFCRLLKASNKREADGLYYSATRAKKKLTETFLSSLDHSYFSQLEVPEDRAAMLLEIRELPLNLDYIPAVCVDWPKEVKEWRERSRPSNWPSSELIDDVIRTGKCCAQK